jgi:hypothetical protein
MAKANKRFRGGHRTHSNEGEVKIPLKYRIHNKEKWTNKKKLRKIKEQYL